MFTYLLACQVRVTVGDPGLCCCVCVAPFERYLTPSCVDTEVLIFNSVSPWVKRERERESRGRRRQRVKDRQTEEERLTENTERKNTELYH